MSFNMFSSSASSLSSWNMDGMASPHSGLVFVLMVASAVADLVGETWKTDGASRLDTVGERLVDDPERSLRLLENKSIFMAGLGVSSESDESGMRMYLRVREWEESRWEREGEMLASMLILSGKLS